MQLHCRQYISFDSPHNRLTRLGSIVTEVHLANYHDINLARLVRFSPALPQWEDRRLAVNSMWTVELERASA